MAAHEATARGRREYRPVVVLERLDEMTYSPRVKRDTSHPPHTTLLDLPRGKVVVNTSRVLMEGQLAERAPFTGRPGHPETRDPVPHVDLTSIGEGGPTVESVGRKSD